MPERRRQWPTQSIVFSRYVWRCMRSSSCCYNMPFVRTHWKGVYPHQKKFEMGPLKAIADNQHVKYVIFGQIFTKRMSNREKKTNKRTQQHIENWSRKIRARRKKAIPTFADVSTFLALFCPFREVDLLSTISISTHCSPLNLCARKRNITAPWRQMFTSFHCIRALYMETGCMRREWNRTVLKIRY